MSSFVLTNDLDHPVRGCPHLSHVAFLNCKSVIPSFCCSDGCPIKPPCDTSCLVARVYLGGEIPGMGDAYSMSLSGLGLVGTTFTPGCTSFNCGAQLGSYMDLQMNRAGAATSSSPWKFPLQCPHISTRASPTV